MEERPSRADLAARVDALASEHEGDAFVQAITGIARDLDAEGRLSLQEILLERGAAEEARRAIRRRAEARGWIRRTLRRAEERAEALMRRRRG